MPHVVGQLSPIKAGLPEQRRVLADALRTMFARLTPPAVRVYAAKKSIHASTVSRYLSGWTLPTEEFIQDLIDAVELQTGEKLQNELDRLRQLLYDAQDSLPGTWSHRKNLQERARRAQLEATAAAMRAKDIEAENRILRDRVDELLQQLAAVTAHETIAPEHSKKLPEQPALEEPAANINAAPVVAEVENRWWLTGPAGYWPAYARSLSDHGWAPAALTSLDSVTDRVLSLLADPYSPTPRAVRGEISMLPGSGKTTNIVATIAKAADAGYRLIIVLAGTLESTRRQLQERIDKDLTALPGTRGIFRLTSPDMDYRVLRTALTTLKFEKVDETKPLNTRENLPGAAPRIVVVKRNSAVLKKLITDLARMPTPPEEIPALVIDSDPTVTPESVTDRLVMKLIERLPRANYLTYWTTPFGWVPRLSDDPLGSLDFAITLSRPTDHLGPEDFLDDAVVVAEPKASKRKHGLVRRVAFGPPRLQAALDMFILAGAIKCYRESVLNTAFDNHTMLLGSPSNRNEGRAGLYDGLRSVWDTAGYTDRTGWDRLRRMFQTEIVDTKSENTSSEPVPESFDALLPELDRAILRTAEPEPSQYRRGATQPWSIVVTGPHGVESFSDEGLTVLYLDEIRASQAAAWRLVASLFGSHTGYSDLVRLYAPPAAIDPDPLTELLSAWAESQEILEGITEDPSQRGPDQAVNPTS